MSLVGFLPVHLQGLYGLGEKTDLGLFLADWDSYGLLESRQIITAQHYNEQLACLNDVLMKKKICFVE